MVGAGVVGDKDLRMWITEEIDDDHCQPIAVSGVLESPLFRDFPEVQSVDVLENEVVLGGEPSGATDDRLVFPQTRARITMHRRIFEVVFEIAADVEIQIPVEVEVSKSSAGAPPTGLDGTVENLEELAVSVFKQHRVADPGQ